MKKNMLGFLVVLALAVNTAIWLSFKNHSGISSENGPMENFQAICLGLGCLLWMMAGFSSKNSAEKILLLALALFHLSFLVLEVDMRNLNAPILNKLFNGKIRDAWLGGLWLIVAVFLFKNAKPVWREFLRWIKSPSGALLILSGIFWILSGLIDKSLLGRKDLFREELMEVNSTPLMLAAALLFLQKKIGSRSTDRKMNAEPAQIDG